MIELKNTQVQKSLKVLLIGDSCVDEYYIGTCDRLNPEAPVPIMNIKEHFTTMGMASNVCKNLQALGCTTVFHTNSEKITKTRYIDQRSGQHLLRVDDEPTNIVPWNRDSICDGDEFDAIVISDYNKGFLTYSEIQYLCGIFDGPIFIDTKKTDLRKFNSAYIKINELEYSKRISTADNMIVTLGSRGTMYKKTFLESTYPVEPVDVVDVCGAGDTFLAALTYQYLMTKDMERAIMFANTAASITVQHRGNYAPSLEEINGH
jgi:D-glycero-beta-D-manno-heptose-7-phosphate kinase